MVLTVWYCISLWRFGGVNVALWAWLKHQPDWVELSVPITAGVWAFLEKPSCHLQYFHEMRCTKSTSEALGLWFYFAAAKTNGKNTKTTLNPEQSKAKQVAKCQAFIALGRTFAGRTQRLLARAKWLKAFQEKSEKGSRCRPLVNQRLETLRHEYLIRVLWTWWALPFARTTQGTMTPRPTNHPNKTNQPWPNQAKLDSSKPQTKETLNPTKLSHFLSSPWAHATASLLMLIPNLIYLISPMLVWRSK